MIPYANSLETSAQASRPTSPQRWRLRFSLRSLLIVCTLFALLLGMFMYRVRTQKQAVAEICKHYGQVAYEATWLGRDLPESIKNHFDKNFFEDAVSVTLSDRTVNRRMVTPTDAELEQIVDAILRLPHVTTLRFNTLDLQDDDLARLAPLRHKIEMFYFNEVYRGNLRGNQLEGLGRWTQLQSLTIMLSNLDETFNLQPLASFPNLTYLSIGRGSLDENVFVDISQIESLQTLSLFACRFDGEHLRHLQQLSDLTAIRLHDIFAETNESHIMDESGDYQPLGNPIFRFTPAGGVLRLRCPLAPPFPSTDYERQWLDETLPNVQISLRFSS